MEILLNLALLLILSYKLLFFKRDKWGWVKRTTIIAIIVNGYILFIYSFCITGLGLWSVVGVGIIPHLCLLIAIFCVPFMLNEPRSSTADAGFSAIVIFILYFPTITLSEYFHCYGFYLASVRAEPLVSAINRYHERYGHPPSSLPELVPNFIPEIPSGLPPLRICSNVNVTESCRYPYDLDSNPWILYVKVNEIALGDWDQFVYRPRQHFNGACGYIGWTYEHIND
ncbi:MAG: hypothetical protein BWK79_06515 [Beggiatoa sp. IS2]|nr:MAG: hypothetical protein BWK79_06515 [Beggiatoa sp. IS2]